MTSHRLVAATAVVLCVAGFTSGSDAAELSAGARTAAHSIDRAALEAPIRFLASDALEGRGPSTRGDLLTRSYLATELEGLGYKPGGPNGSWEQPFNIVAIAGAVPKTWTFTAKGRPVELKFFDDFMAESGVEAPVAAVDHAQLVFVGYGIEAPEYKWDDYKGVDVKGKILVMLNNDPDWDPKLFEGKRRLYYGRWPYKYESGARHGAAGVIIIHTTASAGYPWQVLQSSGGDQFELPAEGEPRIQLKTWMTEAAMSKLLAAAGQNLDKLVAAARSRTFKPVPLGIETSFRIENKLSKVQTANVAGLMEGSDPRLKSEVVIYTAHHDHLGIGEPDSTGDRIYNGALDNASGCAQILAIARAFAALPEKPRRSVLFLFVAAEEQGLVGSMYYAQHPTFAPGKIAADLNFDVGNMWGRTRDITLVSRGKSTVDAVVDAVAAMQGRVVKPDQFPDRGEFYRSDQFAFAKIGVPALFPTMGTDVIGQPAGWGKERYEEYEAKRYHQPSDQLDAGWNFDGMIEDAQLGFYSGWLIAQAETMPTLFPGDEFEAVRKKALAEH